MTAPRRRRPCKATMRHDPCASARTPRAERIHPTDQQNDRLARDQGTRHHRPYFFRGKELRSTAEGEHPWPALSGS